MAYENPIKTEHNGAKHGRGAYYGVKQEAKAASNKARRENARQEIKNQLNGS